MKVTIDEAAKILKCSKANVYQQIKAHRIKTELEDRVAEYTATRKIKKLVFELDDLKNRKGE